MARRPFAQEPTSKLALWARRVAFFSMAAVVLSIVIVRSGFLEIRPALATFAAALLLAVLALLLAFAAFVAIWRNGSAGLGAALTAIVVAVALLAYPVILIARSYDLPWIYDITTDPIDPPRYDMLAKVRPRDANPVIYAGLSAAEKQIEAYPDIEPLKSVLTASQAYEAALSVVKQRKWLIVNARAPERGDGRIEAVARTPIMGFHDDVVIRVRAEGQGSRIDIRSSSRYGTFDFGTNAARVRGLLDDIDAALDEHRPSEAPPQATRQPRRNQPSARR